MPRREILTAAGQQINIISQNSSTGYGKSKRKNKKNWI
jgi:hypothetical protein